MNNVKKINIKHGTNSTYRESNGNTLPHVQLPFGSQSFVNQTDGDNGSWFYNPHVSYSEGVRVSNQPSPWLRDCGKITIMPFTGDITYENSKRHSSIEEKIMRPDRLNMFFHRYQTNLDLIPSHYGCNAKLSSKTENLKILIDTHGNLDTISYEDNALYISINASDLLKDAPCYQKHFVFKFNSKFVLEQSDNYIILDFLSNEINMIMSTSYISMQQLNFNLSKEEEDFENAAINATKTWEEALNKIPFNDDSDLNYTMLYRVLCFPRAIHEYNIEGNPIFLNFKTGIVCNGPMYTEIGYWDTFRTSLPLLRKYYNNIYRDIVHSCIAFYNTYEWLPRWIAPIERGIMPSTLVDITISEALLTGNISSELIDTAISALYRNAFHKPDSKLNGREQLEVYNEYNYIPFNIGKQSVSTTLDYYYCDFSIYQVFKKFNVYLEEQKILQQRFSSYKKLFNKKTNFFEPIDDSGNFIPNYDHTLWGTDFCECSAWQNRFNIPYDVEGLINLYGSKENALKCLDEVFESFPNYNVGLYEQEIHEMTEMIKHSELGYFAISNQPSFSLIFWYLILDKPDKFKHYVNLTLKHFEDSYPGDEDNGSLSAWYIFIKLGEYPFIVGNEEFLKFEI